ncbi:hypothetical protein SISSUDRAFT_1124477 [Sistotremastrum suecicum HHB10207 ss-3]|uniref:Protein kinase domain-containing protein n=1 Tax=Sistotremastrum suecicum HHB10207 ss-3 TaxID=1314776 RepID=A0A166IJ78_9AGAM|nr:hypothetical protein SISSUDRAFT_1124477 [Sistotremastrum suecicum HHB10207 ss-3]
MIDKGSQQYRKFQKTGNTKVVLDTPWLGIPRPPHQLSQSHTAQPPLPPLNQPPPPTKRVQNQLDKSPPAPKVKVTVTVPSKREVRSNTPSPTEWISYGIERDISVGPPSRPETFLEQISQSSHIDPSPRQRPKDTPFTSIPPYRRAGASSTLGLTIGAPKASSQSTSTARGSSSSSRSKPAVDLSTIIELTTQSEIPLPPEAYLSDETSDSFSDSDDETTVEAPSTSPQPEPEITLGEGWDPEIFDVEDTYEKNESDNSDEEDDYLAENYEGLVESYLDFVKAPQSPHETLPIFRPTGPFADTMGKTIENVRVLKTLSEGAECRGFIKRGVLDGKEITYISKEWPIFGGWRGFYAELALYASHLKELQGDCVPRVIGVFVTAVAVSVAFELPHARSWFEAHPRMSPELKEKVIQAYTKVHAKGVIHNDVERRHILIGEDGRVVLIDFNLAASVHPVPEVELERCRASDLARELRKVKVKLRCPGAIEREQARVTLTEERVRIYHAAKLRRRRGETVALPPNPLKDAGMVAEQQFEADLSRWLTEHDAPPETAMRRYWVPSDVEVERGIKIPPPMSPELLERFRLETIAPDPNFVPFMEPSLAGFAAAQEANRLKRKREEEDTGDAERASLSSTSGFMSGPLRVLGKVATAMNPISWIAWATGTSRTPTEEEPRPTPNKRTRLTTLMDRVKPANISEE